jgi:hypothetical protein
MIAVVEAFTYCRALFIGDTDSLWKSRRFASN